MKNLRKLSGLALALLGSAPGAVWAQMAIPAAPAAALAAPPLAAGAAPVPVAAAAPPRNIWSFLCLTPEQKAACKAKFCASQFGRLINNTMAPMSAFTGGVISQPCPLIDPAGLAADPTSALGAASQVQKDTAEAAARRVAIRYISTANCNWWPEVQAALANTLRTDRNECVRLEAALALQRGCCCNRITIKALVNSLSVFPDDSNPREDSPRVRGAAMAALQHCLACFVAIAVPPPPPPEKVPAPAGEAPPPPALKGPGPLIPAPMLPGPPVLPVPPGPVSVAEGQHSIRPASYRNPAPEPSMEQLVQKARRVLQQAQQQMAQNQRPNLIAPFPANDRCLLAVIEDSLHPSPPKQVNNNRIPSAPPAAGTGGTMVEPPMLQPVPRFAPAPLSPQSRIIPVPVAPASVNASLPTALPPTPASQAYAPNSNASQPASSSARIGTPQLVPPTPKLPETADYETMETRAAIPTKGIIWEESDTVADTIPPQPPPTRSASAPAAAKPAELYAGITASQTMPVVETPSQQETAVLPVPTASSQAPTIYQLIEMLKSSPQPKMRQWAARSLTRRSGPTPNVVHALLSGAAKDASTDVRDACLQGLLQLGVYDPELLAKVDWPKIDSDPRVREAVWRLVLFGTAVPGDQVVHDAARALNQWLQSRSPTARPSRS